MDALSEALRTVRLTSTVYLDAEFSSPWGFTSPPPAIVAPLVADNCDRLVICHLLRAGRARVHVESGADTWIEAGDILVLPRGTPHTLSNGDATRFVDAADVIAGAGGDHLATVCAGGGGRITRVVSGYLGCARHCGRLLLDGLPSVLTLRTAGDSNGDWLEHALRSVLSDVRTRQPGHRALLSRLSEALVIEMLRRYTDRQPSHSAGRSSVLAARDPIVGRTLAVIRSQPSRDWTIASLADSVGSSRSVLTERFSQLLGQPPMTYIAHMRLRIAAQLLKTTKRSVLDVACDVGYQSEAAFIRAFKREFGDPPGRFRRN